jgi:hypothetical protein
VISVIVEAVISGIQVGLLAGVLAGAITWAIMHTPESLFRGIFGFALGFIGFALYRGQDVVGLWSQISATAGGAIPRGLTEYTLGIAYQAIVGGLIGMAFFLGITAPAITLRGALLGGLLGIFLGIVLQIVINATNLPVDSIYYAPAIGMIVLVVFAVFGSNS